MTIPTIHIHHDGFPGGVIINADEFDASVHRRFGESAVQAPAAGGCDPDPEVKDSNGGTDNGPSISAPRRKRKGR